jgi:hypothetical protein
VDAGDGFTHILGRPRNFAGELTKMAMRNPRFILRLGQAEISDRRFQIPDPRPNCRFCFPHCADGAECARLTAGVGPSGARPADQAEKQ